VSLKFTTASLGFMVKKSGVVGDFSLISQFFLLSVIQHAQFNSLSNDIIKS
jgi:hypothetical protein